MDKIKRGRPYGSRNKKRRGRPLGSKSKLTYASPIKKVGVTCNKYKRHYQIRTDKPELYTPEIKKTWTCPVCKPPKCKGK